MLVDPDPNQLGPGIDVGPPPGQDAGMDAAPPDVGPDEPDAGAPDTGPPDAGPPPGDGVVCGELTCPSDRSCCIPEGRNEICVVAPEDCACDGFLCDTAVFECDGPEDCPGQRCCAEQTVQDEFTRARCQPACEDPVVGDSVELCHPGAPDTCGPEGECENDRRLPRRYFRCSNT